jgi:hypothetical protein
MKTKPRMIEVDETTAEALEARAAELGISVSQLLAEFAAAEQTTEADFSGQLQELERRWQRVEDGAEAVANEKVVRWLETWGTSGFRPRHEASR